MTDRIDNLENAVNLLISEVRTLKQKSDNLIQEYQAARVATLQKRIDDYKIDKSALDKDVAQALQEANAAAGSVDSLNERLSKAIETLSSRDDEDFKSITTRLRNIEKMLGRKGK